MQKKALLALMLALTMLLSSCALIQKDPAVDAATEIVRVGDTVYTKAQVQARVNYELEYMAYMYSMYGMSYDITDPAIIADTQEAVVNELVKEAVINAKIKELGMDQLTAEDEAEIKTTAEAYWQEYRTYVQNLYITDKTLEGEALEAAIDAELAAQGLTYELLEESDRATFAQDKLYDHVTAGVTVSDEEIQAEFDTLVAEAKEDYASNLSSYGYDVNNGIEVYYRPAGYRMVKQILVKFNEADQAVIDALQSKLNTANSTVTTQTNTLTGLLISNVDELVAQVDVKLDPISGEVTGTTNTFAADQDEAVSTAATALASARAQATYYQTELTKATETALNNLAPAADEVLAQLEAGADWDTLMAEKTEDPGMQGDTETARNGYAVCEGYTYFDEAFTAAAMAIPAVGQWSDKTAGSYGYYIIYFDSEVAEGPVALADVSEDISATLLTGKQEEVYNAQVEAWVAAANAKIDLTALND